MNGRMPFYKLFWRFCILFVVAVSGGAPFPAYAGTVRSDSWSRGFIDSGITSDVPPVRCELSFLTSTRGHLVGEFNVVNLSSSSVVIEGTKTSDGRFWPYVTAQVTDGLTKREWVWRTVGQPSSSRGQKAVLEIEPLTKDPKSYNKRLVVDMGAFKRMIDKATYGRVVFRNGRWSMFELKDLSPPKGSSN